MIRFLNALLGLGCVRAQETYSDREHKPVLQQLDGRDHFEITHICFVISPLPVAARKGKWKIHLS